MLLSEAILKGSEGRGQCTRAYELPDGRVCVIGAVAKAIGINNIEADRKINKLLSVKMEVDLVRLNDDQHMTFKEIVDYVKKEGLDVTL